MRLHLFQQDISRYFKNHIRHEENRQCRIIFHPLLDIQVLLEAEDSGITDINPKTINELPNSHDPGRFTYRSINASKYRMQRHGTTCQSTLAMSRLSVVVVKTGSSVDCSSIWPSVLASERGSVHSFDGQIVFRGFRGCDATNLGYPFSVIRLNPRVQPRIR